MNTDLILAAEESHNPLLPATYDILWGGLSFIILLWMFWKFVMPAFTRITAERTEKIEGGIARAKQMQADAEQSKAHYSAALEQATKEASAIRTQAHSEGEQIVSAARVEASTQAAAITARADQQIQVERASALGSLQRDVSELALTLASKIVGETLTDDQRARATVDRFIAELEAAGGPAGESTPS